MRSSLSECPTLYGGEETSAPELAAEYLRAAADFYSSYIYCLRENYYETNREVEENGFDHGIGSNEYFSKRSEEKNRNLTGEKTG